MLCAIESDQFYFFFIIFCVFSVFDKCYRIVIFFLKVGLNILV